VVRLVLDKVYSCLRSWPRLRFCFVSRNVGQVVQPAADCQSATPGTFTILMASCIFPTVI
jgi:hypothetical protein